MPGVTFFCVFVRPETNRPGGGNHLPWQDEGPDEVWKSHQT